MEAQEQARANEAGPFPAGSSPRAADIPRNDDIYALDSDRETCLGGEDDEEYEEQRRLRRAMNSAKGGNIVDAINSAFVPLERLVLQRRRLLSVPI